MLRILYILAVTALIAGTAWAASGMKSERQHYGRGVGIAVLAALQR